MTNCVTSRVNSLTMTRHVAGRVSTIAALASLARKLAWPAQALLTPKSSGVERRSATVGWRCGTAGVERKWLGRALRVVWLSSGWAGEAGGRRQEPPASRARRRTGDL